MNAKSALLSSIVPVILVLAQCGPGPVASKQAIEVTAPAEGTRLLAGDTITVAWTQSVSSPVLSYNYHLGAGWQAFDEIISSGAKQARVVLPTLWYSDSFQIKVEDASGAYTEGLSPYVPERYFFVTSPVAGQTIRVGDSVAISWRANASLFSSLLIELSVDSGKSYNSVYSSGSISPTYPSALWVVGSETGARFSYPSNGCIIRASDYTNASDFSSTGMFQVLAR